jgi:ABC-2 type transport system permease protein
VNVTLARLIGHEWRLHVRNGVVRTLAGVFAALVCLAVVLTSRDLSRAMADAQLLAAANALPRYAQSIDEVAYQRGTFAILPPAPLLSLAFGQSDIHPQHFRITAHARSAQLAGDQLEHPAALHAGRFDFAFIILFLFPLLIIGVSYDFVATDRASGTLRLLAVQGTSIRRLAQGKIAARAVLVVAVPLVAGLAAFIAGAPTWDGAARLLPWMVGAAAYGAFWLGAAVHVNAGGRSAAANALALTGLWLTLAIVLPSIVNLATRMLFPVPSRVQLDIAMREASRDAVTEGSRLLGRFLEDHPATGTGEEGMKQYYALQEARDRRVAATIQPLLAQFDEQQRAQARAIGVLQFASPTILTQMLLTDLAGTSGHRAQRFARQATAFHAQWRAHFTPDVLTGSPAATAPPVFSYDEEPAAEVLRRTGAPLVALTAVAVALLWTGARRFARVAVTEAA